MQKDCLALSKFRLNFGSRRLTNIMAIKISNQLSRSTDQDDIKTLRKIPERLHYNSIFVKCDICSLFQKLFSQ